LALLGHSTVELGGRSGNLAWHAPTNDYHRKTKFPYRKTRIAGISQSKFVPTVVNDLRRKMRGWMSLDGGLVVVLRSAQEARRCVKPHTLTGYPSNSSNSSGRGPIVLSPWICHQSSLTSSITRITPLFSLLARAISWFQAM
jgi:hypothetical protein